jgi:translation initiation factor IF-2
MAQINVTQFAQQLGLPPALLIEQLQAAGVNKALAADTPLTEKDKTQLLEHLRKSHGAAEAKQKITLTRRQTSEIKKSDSMGKSRTIQVEVRKKRVLVKRDAAEPEAQPEPAKPVLDAEQIALREAEARQQAELAARQAEDAEQKRRKKEAEAVADAEARIAEEAGRWAKPPRPRRPA